MAYLKGNSYVDGSIYINDALYVNTVVSQSGPLPTINRSSNNKYDILLGNIIKYYDSNGKITYSLVNEIVNSSDVEYNIQKSTAVLKINTYEALKLYHEGSSCIIDDNSVRREFNKTDYEISNINGIHNLTVPKNTTIKNGSSDAKFRIEENGNNYLEVKGDGNIDLKSTNVTFAVDVDKITVIDRPLNLNGYEWSY